MIYALTFYLIAVMAAPFALVGQGTLAKVLFFVSLGLSVATGLLAELRRRGQSPP